MHGGFNEIEGNAEIKAYVARQLASGRITNSVLICGPEGSGKEAAAEAMASALMCFAPEGTEPCGRCEACVMASRDLRPELMVLRSEDGKAIRVSSVRSAIEFISLKPAYAARKVCIVLEADRMNEEAQNAFLKTLEEPPDNCVIIMTCVHKEKLLPTVLSRMAILSAGSHTREDIYRYIVNNYPEYAELSEYLYRFSEGRPGVISDICQNDELIGLRRHFIELTCSLLAGEPDSVYVMAGELDDNKTDSEYILKVIMTLLGDVLRIKLGLGGLINLDAAEQLETAAAGRDAVDISDCIAVLSGLRRLQEANVNPRLAFETTFLRIGDK